MCETPRWIEGHYETDTARLGGEAMKSGRELWLEKMVEWLGRESKLNRSAAEKHYAYGEVQKELAEAAEDEVERLRDAITGLRAAHHSGDRDEWEAAVRVALRGGGK